MMERKKVLDLDKICRVCICERKDMRPLFSEKVAEMLMECATVSVEPTEGWPDKICVQCVHSVSRCHAFKKLVERNDKELREYIKSITVRVVIDEKPHAEMSQSVATTSSSSSSLQTSVSGGANQSMRVPQTTRVVLDEVQGLKLQQSHAKLVELQQQQQMLLQQQQEQQLLKLQQQEQMQMKLQQQRQQKLIQKQLKQQQEEEEDKQKQLLQQRSLLQQQTPKRKSPLKKLQPLAKKNAQQLQEHTQNQQQLQTSAQQNQQQQQQLPQLLQQNSLNLNDSLTLHSNRLSNTHHHQQQTLLNPPHLMPLSSNNSNNTTNTVVSTNANSNNHNSNNTSLPQQIVMPNGQIITTTQILTTNGNGGPPQLAQIINNPNHGSMSQQHQFAPQLIQTSNGQTLQLIQQPNGQQILQLVQIVPQRGTGHGGNGNNSNTTTILDEDHIAIVDDDALMAQSEQHLIDDVEEDEDETNLEDHLQSNEREQICETIVVEDDHLQIHHAQHHHLLHQNVELEYLEDVTVTTSQQHQAQSEFVLPDHVIDDADGAEELEENEEDIIEEVAMEEEMLDDDVDQDAVLLDNSNGSEFLSIHGDQHQVFETDDNDFVEDNSLTHYTVVEGCVSADPQELEDVDGLEDPEVNAVFQAACDESERQQQQLLDNKLQQQLTLNSPPSATKRPRRTNTANNRTLANSRQLQATACSIAQAAQDEDFEIDSKLIAEFINQQTTVLGSGRYKCNLCQQEFKQFKGLQNHMHSHSNWIRANCKKQPQCEICHKSFKGPGMLRMHMKTHQSAGKVPTCHICNKAFKSKAILYRHRQTHQQRSYSCAVENCRKHFSTAITLKAHIERKHPDPMHNPKYKCGECNNAFYDIDSLEEHLQLTGHGGVGNDGSESLISNVSTQNLNLNNVQNGSSLAPPTVTMTEVVSGNGDVYIVTQA